MELSYNGSGKILYREKKYRCDLYLKEDEGGILFKIYIDEPVASFIELPLEIDCLPGKLDNGFNFTAFRCSRTHTEHRVTEGCSVFTFQAHFMLKGIGSDNPDGTKLYKVVFGLAGILQWGTFSGYKIGEEYSLSNGDPVEISIYENDQVEIKYLVNTSMLPVTQDYLLKDEITLFQLGVIEIRSKSSEKYDFFEKYYHIVKRLIEISTAKSIKLTYVKGWSHNVYYDIEEKQIEMPIPILTSELCPNHKDEKDDNRIYKWEWFTLPELIENNSFSLYMSKYDMR